jgi:hypothetical protein
VLLRFYTERGRSPRSRGEIPDTAVDYTARQVGVPATELVFYDWSGRTIESHRGQIRRAPGFRECSVADADKLTEWLVTNVAQAERGAERVHDGLLARCREERIDRIVRSALHRGEELLFARVAIRLSEAMCVLLKEAVLRTGCLSAVTSVADRGTLPEHVLADRVGPHRRAGLSSGSAV